MIILNSWSRAARRAFTLVELLQNLRLEGALKKNPDL